MTKDDIIRMAKETSATRSQAGLDAGTLPWLEHFASLVAAAERKKFGAVLRQLHDSYVLASDPSGLRVREEKA